MSANEKYLHFCTEFNNIKLPQIKFKNLNDRYKHIYKNEYKIDEITVNKASFFVFTVIFSSFTVISTLLLGINIFYLCLISLIVSIAVTYKFNLYIYNKINKREVRINALLYLLRIDFELLQTSLKKDADYCLSFIKLMTHYDIPLSEFFKTILSKIHDGNTPEAELNKIVTPSKDFNDYLRGLLINNFHNDNILTKIEEKTLEKNFKIFLRQVQHKIALLFFVGVFFPIGSCFFILFQIIDPVYIFIVIPILFLLLRLLYQKFMKVDSLLIGILNEGANSERKKFNEFLILIKNFAINLGHNTSPEKAFIDTYTQHKEHFHLLKTPILAQVSSLVSLSYSFSDIMEQLKIELVSSRYQFIIESIKKMVKENAYYTSTKILDIVNIVRRHKKLEKDLNIIIQGEKFKIFTFLILLPLIVGAIGGIFPFYTLLGQNLNLDQDVINLTFTNPLKIIRMLNIFFTLMACVVITSYYFLKIINRERHSYFIFLVAMEFIFVFFLSYSTAINFF